MKGTLRAASATGPLSGRPGSAARRLFAARASKAKPAFTLLHPRSSRDVGGQAEQQRHACRGERLPAE